MARHGAATGREFSAQQGVSSAFFSYFWVLKFKFVHAEVERRAQHKSGSLRKERLLEISVLYASKRILSCVSCPGKGFL